jgi:hypothetical protein
MVRKRPFLIDNCQACSLFHTDAFEPTASLSVRVPVDIFAAKLKMIRYEDVAFIVDR